MNTIDKYSLLSLYILYENKSNMDGGSGLFNPNIKVFEYLVRKHRAGELTIVPFGTASVGGYLYKITIQNPDRDFLKIHPGTADILSPLTTIILKLIQIRNVNELDTTFNDKEIVDEVVFDTEVRTQVHLFESSFDMYCEPICPQIFDRGYIFNNSRDFYNLSYISSHIANVLSINFGLSRMSRNANKMGYICMELMGNTYPVADAFPTWDDTHPFIDYNNVSPTQKIILDNYFYQLERMRRCGYSHGDTHLHNALYIDNYDYIDNYRVYIIDFGRTTPVVSTQSLTDQLVTPGGYWSYEQLRNYVMGIDNIHGINNYVNELCNKRQVSMNNFLEKLYLKTSDFRELQRIIPRIKHVVIPPEFQYRNVFEYQRIPLRNVDGVIYNNVIHINPRCDCCQFVDPTTNMSVFVKPFMSSYGQRIISMLNASNLLEMYVNESFHNFPHSEGIFNWVIGIDAATQQTWFYCIHVNNAFEIGTKQVSLIQYYGISQIYAAGAMYKYNNTDIYMNILSGTYMISPANNGLLTITDIDKIIKIVPRFVENKINEGVNPANKIRVRMMKNPYESFIRQRLFCYRPVLVNIQIDSFIKYNRLVAPDSFFIKYDNVVDCSNANTGFVGGKYATAFELNLGEPFIKNKLYRMQKLAKQKYIMPFGMDNQMKKKPKDNLRIEEMALNENDISIGDNELNTIRIPFHEISRKHIKQINNSMKNPNFKKSLSIVLNYVANIRSNARNVILLKDENVKETVSSKLAFTKKTHSRSRKPKTSMSNTTKRKNKTKNNVKSNKTKKWRHSAP